MCDCFHLAFPNWHASAAGEGRRLKEPEQDTDDDLVCEEPEVLEGERPRPQGSSPVEEFPTTEKYAKQVEGDFYDSPTKSSKKSKRIGFGSLFDKRSSAKMNQTEDMQSDQSEIIVKTVKEVCAEGLVVSGGKDGIFIKEVKPESPASKHLSVKEGDQILSATVYFDNVSYEDALQILEHAQPYKVAFCLKRKPPPRTQEDAETERPDITIGEEAEQVEEGSGPEMRGRRKTKKQHDRISWPKFPTFSIGRRANFKRSHSTSEAEEQRKLEISPPTSDTESPLKSPLKSPDGKDKKKKHKVKPKKRMAGRRSKSVEETQENKKALATDNMKVLDNQIIMNIVEEQVPMTNVIESPKILNEAENIDSTKTGNEYTFPTLPATESLHKVELISVDTTLKTTDITVTLGDDGKERREKSELKVSIPGKDKYEIETESQLKSSTSGMRTLDPSTFDNILDSPNVISQTEPVRHQVDSDSKPIIKEILEKTQESGKTDMTIAKVDVSLDMPEVGPISKLPRIGSDKEKKERNILETESYGIRTRGPLADIATSKSHFSNAVNKLDFTSDTCEIQTREDMSSTDTKKPITPTPVISQPKSHALDVDRSRKSTGGSMDIESNFKLPKVDVSEFDHQESITVNQKDPTKVPLLKREEIEISGMEDIGSKAKVKPPRIKEQKVEKIIKISKAGKKQDKAEAEEFNVKDVKDAVSKFPAFKLPERDITGVLVQREITIMEIKSDKTGMTPKGSPCKIPSMSTEININLPDTMDKEKQILSPVATKDQTFVLPKIEQLHLDEMVIIKSKTDLSKIKLADHQPITGKMLARDDKISTSPDVKFKLPKREDIEIPGIEAIEQSVQPTKSIIAKDTDTQDEAVKEYTDTNIKADKNVHEKKSKKSKVSMPSFGIMTPDIRFPGIVIELPIKATSPKSDSGTIKERTTEAKISEDNIKKSSEEATFKKSQKGESCAPEHETKKAHDIESDQMLHHDVCTAIVKETSKQDVEGELKAEIKSKGTDSSPQKKKLHKLKMPKIGGKSMKGTAEVTTKEDVTVQENDIIEVELDSEKRTIETDPKAYSVETKLKMPSIDVFVPKIKIPKAEGKSKAVEPEAVEAIEDAQEESGFRLIKFGISMPKEKTEEGGLLPDESEKSIIKVSGKTEVEPSELPQAEMKVAESKMKKRKISFPKFGFSKSDTKVSDADITLPAAQGSLHDADGTELDVKSKTKDVEAEFKDSTDYPTKFKLPTIKFPKFGVSFPKTTDAGGNIQKPDVSTDEAKLPVEATALSDKKGMEMTLSVSKPEVDLSLPEGKAEIKGFQKKEIKSSEEMSFSKPDIDASLTGHDAEEIPAIVFSKQDIKAAGVDVSLPQVDLSIPEVSVEIKESGVHFTISKDEAEHKDLTNGGTPVKFPSISLPKFGGKSSKVVKDMPFVDIDTEEPDESLPETQISMQLKDDAPAGDIKDSFETTEGQFVSVDMKVEETKLKEQEVTVTLPKFGISLPKVEAHKPTDSVDKEESTIDPRESNADSDQAEKDPRTPTKIKRPTIKFPKVGVSFPKSTDAVSDNQMPEVTKDEPAMEIKALETELPTESPSLPEMKTPHIILSVSKPEVDVSTPEVEKAIDEHSEKKKEKVLSSDYAFSKPEVKMSLVGHGLDQETAIEGLKMQASNLEAEVNLPSGSVEEVILEAKEKESEFKLKKRKISFPKFGFYKSDTKIPDADTSLQKEGISVPDTVIKETEMTFPAPEVEVQLKNKSTSGSPSKFKLPTISLPKFDISISKTGEESVEKSEDDAQSEIKAASAVASQDKDTGTQDTEPSKSTLETLPMDAEIKTKDTDPSSQGSRFMMPKFEFSFQKLKGPEFKKGASRTDAEKSEVPLKHDKESAEGKAGIPEASVEMEVTLKMPKMPSSEHEFSEQDIKALEINVERGDTSMAVGEVDVNLESDLKIQTTQMLKDDSTMGGSQIKFKLPSFKLPKFRSSSSKVKAEIMDLRGEEITLETEDLITSVEPSDVKIDSNVPGQELKKPSISADQTKVDSGDQYILSLTEARISKAEGYISLPEAKLGEVSQATLESKIDQEVGLKDTGMKIKKTGFSLPKFGFSKPDIKAPEIDVSLAQVDTSKPESDLKIKEQTLNITVSNVEDDQKDTTALSATAKFPLPSINIPKIGGQATKEEKTMPVVDIAVKGPEVIGSDTQIKISGEAPSVDIKRPHLATEGQSVSVDLNVEDAELGGQGGKFKMPKFGIGLPKVKGFDLSTSKTDDITEVKQIHITKPAITTEGMVQPPEQDSKFLDVQIKPSPEFGFSKPEIKAPEVDVSIQKTDIPIPEGSMDLEEINVDIKVSKMESDQKGSTIFGSPTKFKLPSISFPKFGVKSQKVALDINVADSELEGTNIKTDISKPDVKLEVQTPKSEAKVEGSADMPEVDSKGLQVKVKRSSFSFPKFGFSKPDTATPEVNISVPKAEVSIPEVNVPVKEQTAQVTLPGGEAEQKDLMIVSSPTKFKLPEVNLPKFGVKTSKGTVSLPSADKDIKGIVITVHEPDIKLSGQIQKTELDVKEIETDIHATIRETDVHLAEGKVILPQPDVDVQDISIEGKADMSEVDLKGHDVKLKKPSFSLPKFGFSKTDIKGQDVDAIQPKADMFMQEDNIPVEDKDAEITITDEVKKQGDTTTQTKFKLPSFNLPKFGLKYPKATADIPAAEVDIKEPEISFPEKGEVQTTDTETNIDIKGPSADVDIKVKEIDDDGTGSTFKLTKFGIGMPKVKEIEMEGKEINIETDLLCKENVNVQQPGVEIQNVTTEGKTDKVEVDSKGLKVKLPKLGFSKPDLKAPEVDVSLPKADMGTSVGNVDVSKQSADIQLPEQDLYLKEDTFGSPTRFKLPTISFPKFGTKASKDTADIPMAHVDIKVPEVSLPDKMFNMSGEVSSVEMKGPTVKKELILPKGSVEVDVEAKGAELEVEESKIKLPQFGISLQASKSPEFDISVSKAEVSKTDVKKAGTEKDVEIEELAGLTDLSSKGLKMKKPSFGFPNIGFSKSDGKSQDIQATETTADISLPGGNTEIEESEREGKTEITGPKFGSPTKFKLPTIKLPKFGLSAPKVPSDAAKADSETKEIKVSSVDYEIETSKLDPSGDIKGKTAEMETPSTDIDIKEKELNQEGQEIKFKLPKFGISLPKVKGPEVTVTAKEVHTETPEIGFTEPEIKMQAEDASLPKVDMALQESSSLEKKEVETELKDDTVVSGSPSKFKLPTFKMPKFGISTQKTSDAKVKVAEVDVPDANTDLNIEDKPIQMSKEIQREGEIKEITEQLPDTAAKKLDGDKGSPSKFKFPTIKMPKISISRTKSQEGEDDTTSKVNAPDAKIETKDDTQGPGKSPKFTMPTFEDVLRGFEVEFNVPTIEEMEAQKDKPSVKQDQEAEAKVEETAEYKDKGAQEKSKFKFKFPTLGFSQSSDESDKLVDAKIEESEKHLEASADQKATVSKEQAKTEKGGWFKFSFSSPTKTSKTDGKEIIQPPEEAEKLDDVEKESSKAHEEPEKISLSEAVEENISPTLSLKSSEAFADISSTVTTEQIGLSQTSPTKVKVKYAEPTATVGVSDVQNYVVTSTARCELISMEPHQPEKVNIPFLLDMSSASVDTLKQMSGEIHVITSNIQAISERQQASILTNLDVHGIHTSPLQVTLGSDSVLTVEETRVQSGTHTLMERHVVNETLHDDKETILVTQRTRAFEGDSAEPISDETASSIHSLRDTVHTEKISFFDSAATIEEVTIVSSETSLRHMDSSTDENGGK
ncbi:neuroblast differentiation-associated protein AHNAK-like [Sinocyclocheilus grahami]|uniref:neuroblast differentiation-associated protein AHNAK-like n=1 Tax=Sinocyclocheilus grahami TaxID=75366 RepID=UPI0007AD3E53|nr:PREDICTED: neuroblast differentiation-associated protein AHNAK-like [Sinocyclocheilus grahami]